MVFIGQLIWTHHLQEALHWCPCFLFYLTADLTLAQVQNLRNVGGILKSKILFLAWVIPIETQWIVSNGNICVCGSQERFTANKTMWIKVFFDMNYWTNNIESEYSFFKCKYNTKIFVLVIKKM